MKNLVILLVFIFGPNSFAQLDWLKIPDSNQLYKKNRLSIVFASQNLKSPVSMFGHTFLVAHNEMPPEPDAITIEFLGRTYGDFNQYLNALVSRIEGEFRLSTFIIKNREYDFEDRNLWVYELNLTENEKNQIFSLVSDSIKKEKFSYTFLNRNCSYYIFNAVVFNKNFDQNSIYTLPKYTIRELKNRGIISKSPILIETDQSRLNNYVNELSDQDNSRIKLILAGYSYDLSNERWEFKHGLDLALNFKIPREPDPNKRNLYFKTKQSIMSYHLIDKSENPTDKLYDPLDSYGDSNLRFGHALKENSVFIEGKFAQRDFYTSMNDGLSNSYLEIAKAKVSFDSDQGFQIQQFTIFKLESLLPGSDYNESFNRLIDLSFYNNTYEKHSSAHESVLRFGQGFSLKKNDLAIGTVPYLGLRYFDFSAKKGLEPDIGLLTRINYWINNSNSVELTSMNYFFSKMPFKYRLNFKLSVKLKSNWGLGLESIIFENNNETEFSLVYGF